MDSAVNEPVDSFALFVGSLSANTTQELLVAYFSRFGSVQGVNLITDWATGASKRCAIVFCSDEKTLNSALECKVHKLDGKVIRVTLADQEKKGTKKISTTNLFVGNISEKCTEKEIRLLFDKFGQIESVRFFKNASTKPNTKNAIIQYMDSKSVELAFRSKSEMGSADDCLKISPLKQKKAPQTKAEAFDDLANMMMTINRPDFSHMNYSFGLNVKGFHFGQPNIGSFQELEDFPPVVRRHRKSSSVDVLATKISNADQYGDQGYPGYGHQVLPSFNLIKPSPVPVFTSPTADSIKYQMKLHKPEQPSKKIEIKVSKPEESDLTKEKAADGEVMMGNNFITLIDLFDDEDNLSTSFYGVSPMRMSRQEQSTAKSSRRMHHGDSSSDCHDDNNSSRLSD